ncbi:MAG TPA: hypothetical protein VHD83_24100 [Puia sp.]|nr:hypothetical protein [Puia sp.]
MRRIRVCTISACIILFAGSSCKKAYDYIHSHPDDHISFCRPTHIRGAGYFAYPGYVDTLTFFYNAKGDPIDMLDRSITRNSQDQHWRYDNHDRLIAYYITLPPPLGTPTGSIVYHKYAYPRPNWVTDTIINYDSPEFPPIYKDAFDAHIEAHLLDNRGRIIKTYNLDDPHQPPQLQSEYTYDANGNLEVPNPQGTTYPEGTTYDHMINPYRTSHVFQFTYKDFSLNNLIAIDPGAVQGQVPAYNQFGLPVTLPVPSLTIFTPIAFDAMNSNPIEIDYACSMPKGPIDY